MSDTIVIVADYKYWNDGWSWKETTNIYESEDEAIKGCVEIAAAHDDGFTIDINDYLELRRLYKELKNEQFGRFFEVTGNDQLIETRAKQIYKSWSNISGYVEWVDGGNSINQDAARAKARQELNL